MSFITAYSRRMKDLFKAISEAITTKVAAVRWVDFDLGQLDSGEAPPVSFPCALIGFGNGDYSNLSNLVQMGEIGVVIRVAFKTFERTHSAATEVFRDVGLAHLDILRDIHFALQGLSGPAFSSMTRISMRQEARADLRVYQYTYSTIYTEGPDSPYEPVPEGTTVDLCLDVVVEDTP